MIHPIMCVCVFIVQTSEIHHPTQHFNVASYCATCLSSHKASSGTYYNSLKKHNYILA